MNAQKKVNDRRGCSSYQLKVGNDLRVPGPARPGQIRRCSVDGIPKLLFGYLPSKLWARYDGNFSRVSGALELAMHSSLHPSHNVYVHSDAIQAPSMDRGYPSQS